MAPTRTSERFALDGRFAKAVSIELIWTAPILGKLEINPLGERIIDTPDLPRAFTALGLAILFMGVPLALVVRHQPEPPGGLPDGRPPGIEEGHDAAEIDFSLRQAWCTKAFWMLTIGVAPAVAPIAATTSFGRTYLNERGLHYLSTDKTFDLVAVAGAVWILLLGFLCDKLDKRHLLASAVFLQSPGVVALLNMEAFKQLHLFVAVYSFGSAAGPLAVALRADYFG